MPEIRYGSAQDPRWIAMAAPGCLLVVSASVPRERFDDLWQSVSSAESVQPVLDALTRGGISSTPDFVLATFPRAGTDGPFGLSVIVRGTASVTVHRAAEDIEVSAKGVSTWIEQVAVDATGVDIGTPASAARTTTHVFSLVAGSAPVSWLSLVSSASNATEPAAASRITSARVPPVPSVPPASGEPQLDTMVDPGITITDPTVSDEPSHGDAAGGYDFLFGETVVRTVEGAAVREASAPVAGDHDGKTALGLTPAERRAARAARQGRTTLPVASSLFALEFAGGEKEILDQAVIIGRAPSASKVSASSVPRLVTVGGPDQDISRNHVEVSVEGETVMVTDLHSRNGTMVTLPGRPPQQLRGGQPTAVLVGSVVDLGDGVSFTVGRN